MKNRTALVVILISLSTFSHCKSKPTTTKPASNDIEQSRSLDHSKNDIQLYYKQKLQTFSRANSSFFEGKVLKFNDNSFNTDFENVKNDILRIDHVYINTDGDFVLKSNNQFFPGTIENKLEKIPMSVIGSAIVWANETEGFLFIDAGSKRTLKGKILNFDLTDTNARKVWYRNYGHCEFMIEPDDQEKLKGKIFDLDLSSFNAKTVTLSNGCFSNLNSSSAKIYSLTAMDGATLTGTYNNHELSSFTAQYIQFAFDGWIQKMMNKERSLTGTLENIDLQTMNTGFVFFEYGKKLYKLHAPDNQVLKGTYDGIDFSKINVMKADYYPASNSAKYILDMIQSPKGTLLQGMLLGQDITPKKTEIIHIKENRMFTDKEYEVELDIKYRNIKKMDIQKLNAIVAHYFKDGSIQALFAENNQVLSGVINNIDLSKLAASAVFFYKNKKIAYVKSANGSLAGSVQNVSFQKANANEAWFYSDQTLRGIKATNDDILTGSILKVDLTNINQNMVSFNHAGKVINKQKAKPDSEANSFQISDQKTFFIKLPLGSKVIRKEYSTLDGVTFSPCLYEYFTDQGVTSISTSDFEFDERSDREILSSIPGVQGTEVPLEPGEGIQALEINNYFELEDMQAKQIIYYYDRNVYQVAVPEGQIISGRFPMLNHKIYGDTLKYGFYIFPIDDKSRQPVLLGATASDANVLRGNLYQFNLDGLNANRVCLESNLNYIKSSQAPKGQVLNVKYESFSPNQNNLPNSIWNTPDDRP
jgi:hypothetical protein